MGREVKRVPLDFDWPLKETWKGYLSPDELDEAPCPDCARGYSPAGEWLQTLMYRLSMLAGDIRDQQRGMGLHPWLANDTYPPTTRDHKHVYRPSADILELVAGLSETTVSRMLEPFGRASEYRMAQKVIAAAGLPEEWGTCKTCNGHGSVEKYPGQRAEAEAWQRTEPPTGEGFQLWETVSEGSPTSPVFATADELALWMSRNPCGFAGSTPSLEHARAFVAAGWSVSMVGDSNGVVDGITAIGISAGGEA